MTTRSWAWIGVAAALFAPAAVAQTPPKADPAKVSAAMGQIKKPGGVGGCVFLAVPVKVRGDTLVGILAGKGATSPALEAAVAKVAPGCSGRPYARTDHALVGTSLSTFQKSAAALGLAGEFGVGQTALDDAWNGAGADQKAPYYAVADAFLTPGETVSARDLNVAPLAARAGMAESKGAERWLRMYFLSTAIIERAEPSLVKGGAK